MLVLQAGRFDQSAPHEQRYWQSSGSCQSWTENLAQRLSGQAAVKATREVMRGAELSEDPVIKPVWRMASAEGSDIDRGG